MKAYWIYSFFARLPGHSTGVAVRGVTYELGARFEALPGPGETAAVTP